ncbi:HAD family hydrolase [Paenibacillus sp. P25]|nr:HAD family hydrolase [Paenibacillus sp. P25]
MIRAIVFDFDGLIIDTETVWFECFTEALVPHGIELPLEIFSRGIGTHNGEIRSYLERQTGQAGFYDTIRSAVNELHRAKIASVEAREGVRDYLEQARAAGLRIGLASSSGREWIDFFLNRLGLSDFFEVIMTGDDVTNIKPDPELYLKATAALGVQPSEAVAFEDSANGAKAAGAAGLHCIIVPNPVTAQLTFERYSLRIRSMADQPLAESLHRLEQTLQGDVTHGV